MYYKGLNKDELINLCKEQGLDTSGKKNELVSRLLRADSAKDNIFNQPHDDLVEVKQIDPIKILPTVNFYLQIKSSNLSNYFAFGSFYPLALEESKIYKNENRAKDILSVFEDYIILTKAPINNFEGSDVLVELVLNDIKITEHESSGLFYTAQPIPVSRVKKIYFKTAIAKVNFISSVKTFPDSFIPSSICEIISKENEKPQEIELNKIKLPKNESLSEWEEKLDLFDRILGLFAFIKNANIFYSERQNKFENYSSGFFSALNLINPVKQHSLHKENIYLKPLIYHQTLEINSAQRAIFKSVIERVYNNKTFDFKIAIEILESSITIEYPKNDKLTDIAEQIDLFKQLDRLAISYKELLQKGVIKNTQNLPALALLFLSKFPNKSRQHTDKQAVRNVFIQGDFTAPFDVAEYILGFLGLYYGYKNMIKEDTNLKFSDSIFENLSASTQSIKFKLESYFERFIVESAFQFAAKQKPLNENYEFLNWNTITSENKSISLSSDPEFDYSDESTTLMGQNILTVVRQEKTEKIFDRIAKQYSDKVENASYLAAFFAKYFNLDKGFILDILKRNKGRYPLNELDDVINLDNRENKKVK